MERRAAQLREASSEDILVAHCPARRALSVIGDRWTPVVIFCLSGGIHRFSDLQRRIPDISKKMLTQVLRQLERARLVERAVLQEAPPRTEYRLTDMGLQLQEPVALLCHWARNNSVLLDAIETARRR